jgi:hypothetical protein
VSAQSSDARPAAALEFTAGYAGFVDDSTVDSGMVGGAGRFYLTPRISVGPEVQYMPGPDADRSLIVTGNVTFDVLPPGNRVTPFLVAGAGLFRHTEDFDGRSFSSSEGAFTAGGGVRAWLNDRVYVASELRVSWEFHFRISATVGISLAR